ARALDRLAARGVTGQVLPFRSGFHSPMLAPYLNRILGIFAGLQVRAPTHPIWSATTLDRYPGDPDGIRALATRHLLEPGRVAPLSPGALSRGTRGVAPGRPGQPPGLHPRPPGGPAAPGDHREPPPAVWAGPAPPGRRRAVGGRLATPLRPAPPGGADPDP